MAHKLSQWEEDVASSPRDKPLSPFTEEGEKPQPCFLVGPGSPNSKGHEVAAEAAPALPSASPVPGEELPSLGTQSPVPAPQSPPGSSPVLLLLSHRLSREIVCQALLQTPGSQQQPEGHWHLEQYTDVDREEAATGGREQSPGPAPQRPLSRWPSHLGGLSEQQPGPAAWAVQAEPGSSEEASDGDSPWDSSSDPDMSQGEYDSDSDPELFPGTEYIVQELSPLAEEIIFSIWKKALSPVLEEDEEPASPSPTGTEDGEQKEELIEGGRNSSQGGSQGEEDTEQELSQGVSDWEEHMKEKKSHAEITNCQEHSNWKGYLELSDREEIVEQELPPGDVSSWEEVSDSEELIAQAPSQEEVSLGHDVSHGNIHGSCTHSSWEDDNNPELVHDPREVRCESAIWTKPLAPEEDELDELSVLELPPEEDREQRRRVFEAEGLPVPVPREAWVEEQAAEPCSPGPLCAWPAPLQGQALLGELSSPAQPLHGQPPAPSKRPSRFRRALRALRGLFRCSCLAPRPEE